jgi:tetratricopeptide (TPR) repeat protein
VAGRFNRNADALGAYEEALAVTRAQFGDVHVQTAEALSGVSGALRRMGRLPEALQAAREIAVIDDATLPKTHWRRITHLNYLSNIQSLTGDVRGALDSARSALAIHRANYGDDSPASWVLLQGVGVMEGWLGQYAEATRDMGAALALQERTMGADASGTGMTRCMLGTMFAEWGQLDVAEGHCSKAIADLRRGEPGERVYLATALWYRARIDIERGDAARAMQGIDEALSIVDALGADFSAVARTQMLATRASALQRKGDFSAAAAGMREVLEVLSQQTGAKTARTEMNIGLAEIALAEGRQADAARFAAAAQAIMATTEWPEPQLKRRMDALRTRLGPASAPAAD